METKELIFIRKREGTFLSLHPLQCSSCRVQEIQVNPKVDPYMEVAMAPKAAHHLAIVRSCNAINGVAIVPQPELQLHPLSAENSLLAKFFSPDQVINMALSRIRKDSRGKAATYFGKQILLTVVISLIPKWSTIAKQWHPLL